MRGGVWWRAVAFGGVPSCCCFFLRKLHEIFSDCQKKNKINQQYMI